MLHFGNEKPGLGYSPDLSHPLMKDCVELLLFNEQGGNKVYDLSGKNNHGTLYGMASPPTAISGWAGQGLSFDGVDDYVDAGAGSSLNITDAITIDARIKLASVSGTHRIVRKYAYVSDTSNEGYQLKQVDNKIAMSIYNNTSTVTSEVSTVSSLSVDIWYHITGTWNGSIIKIYLNGLLDNSLAHTTGLKTTAQNLFISYSSSTLNGLINDVRIYNRRLSADEIRELYIEPYCMFPYLKFISSYGF